MSENQKPAEAKGNTRAQNLPGPFQLVLVEKIPAPDGGAQPWYRYVLDNGRSQIAGQRGGGLKEVTSYANEYAQQLNARSVNGHSTWAPRGRKPAAAAQNNNS